MSSKQAKCPKCKSLNVAPMGTNKKGFSVGKADEMNEEEGRTSAA